MMVAVLTVKVPTVDNDRPSAWIVEIAVSVMAVMPVPAMTIVVALTGASESRYGYRNQV